MDERYRLIFEHAASGLLVLSLEGRILEANAAACRLAGREHAALQHRPLSDVFHPRYAQAFFEKLPVLQSLGRLATEAVLLRPAGPGPGPEVLVEACLVPWETGQAILLLLRQLAPREVVQEELHLSHQVLRSIGVNASLAFYLLLPDGSMSRFPPLPQGTVEETGVPGWAWRLVHDPGLQPFLDRAWAGERLTVTPAWYGPEDWEGREAGAPEHPADAHWLGFELIPLRGSGGTVTRILAKIEDATPPRVESERQCQQERDLALALFSAGLLQELNASLGVILAQASALRLSSVPGRLAPPAVGSILDAAQEAAALLRRCSESGGETDEDWVVLDLNSCVLDAARLLARLLDPRIQVHLVLGTDVPKARGSPRLLRAMVLALGRQAGANMPSGGELRLQTHAVSGASPMVPPAAGLTLTDTGLGMSPAIMSQAVQSFMPENRAAAGEPLELTFARAVVQRHRGQYEVGSVPGKGTTWRLALPGYEVRPQLGGPLPPMASVEQGKAGERAHAAPVSRAEAPPAPAPPAQAGEMAAARPPTQIGQRLRILLADDEENIRDFGREVLRQAGYEPIVANDGQEAFEHFQRAPSTFALAILDAYMPRLGGLEAYLRMQVQRPDLPVIFVSGFVRTASRAALLSACPGRAQVLSKPFTGEDLIKAVRDTLGHTGEQG